MLFLKNLENFLSRGWSPLHCQLKIFTNMLCQFCLLKLHFRWEKYFGKHLFFCKTRTDYARKTSRLVRSFLLISAIITGHLLHTNLNCQCISIVQKKNGLTLSYKSLSVFCPPLPRLGAFVYRNAEEFIPNASSNSLFPHFKRSMRLL